MFVFCLHVCPLAYLENHTFKPQKVTAHVACGCSSVILWRHGKTLCISGFADDVTFLRNGVNWAEAKTTLCLV